MTKKLSRKEKERLYLLLKEKKVRECRKDFWAFCVWMDDEFFTLGKPHLKDIASALQDVADGKIKKLAISLPPRAGKSYIISMFCAWVIGKDPTGGIMRNSYAAELAEKFSYDIRHMIQTEKYLQVFPSIKLRKDKKSINDWAVTEAKQTSYFCAGVGGGITGKGCNLVAILDDPIKNIEEALSETVINSIWNWYTSTHMSRLESGCPEIHIATRWSRRDPIGRLISEFPDDWTTIVVPALTDEGNTFCEEIKTTKEFLDIKKLTEDFIWEAEYMQSPIEAKGLLLPIEDLNRFSMKEIIKKVPDGKVGFTDTADQGADYLCAPIGWKFGEKTYITDVLFTQEGVEITEPLVAQLIIDTKCDIMKVESNAGGRSFALNIQKLVKGKSTCAVKYEPTTQNKETRILMSAGYIKEYFYFRDDYEPGSDYDRFMRQLTSYVKMGKNRHDDANDAITGLAEYVKKDIHFIRPMQSLPGKFYTKSELDDLGYKTMDIKNPSKTKAKGKAKSPGGARLRRVK